MSAYVVGRVEVSNWDAYREYMRHTPRLIHQFGGRFIARGGEMVTLEGQDDTGRIVLIEFPSLEKAKAFYHSPEYVKARKLREGAGTIQLIAIDGYPTEAWNVAVKESSTFSLD